LRNSWELGFSADGIHIKTSEVHFFSAWSNFKRLRESVRCILVYIDSTRYYTFPKRCIPLERRTTMLELVHTRLESEGA
jgi:hypothetical protein